MRFYLSVRIKHFGSALYLLKVIGHLNPLVTAERKLPKEIFLLILCMFQMKDRKDSCHLILFFYVSIYLRLNYCINNIFCQSVMKLFCMCTRPIRPDIKTKYEKYFFGDFLSADFWQKLWELIKLPWKISQKICRSESTLNCRSRHLCIKLTHTT